MDVTRAVATHAGTSTCASRICIARSRSAVAVSDASVWRSRQSSTCAIHGRAKAGAYCPPTCCEVLDDVVGHQQQLVPRTEIEQGTEAESVEEEDHVAHAPAFGQVASRSDGLEGHGRSLDRPFDLCTDQEREGAVLRAPDRLCHLEGLREVVQAAPVAREASRGPAVAEGARDEGLDVEPLGQLRARSASSIASSNAPTRIRADAMDE